MNWEQSVLNRIYKTSDFKINFTPINQIKDRSKYKKDVENKLNIFELNDYHVSKSGAIYKLKENRNTIYFPYQVNYLFNVYTYIFDISLKYVGNKIWSFEKHQYVEDEKYNFKMKQILLNLLFIKEYSYDDYSSNLSKIDEYLIFRTFINCMELFPLDIVLLSILLNDKFYQKVIDKYINIKRWANHISAILELNTEKIIFIIERDYKFNLGETYKLNSCQELVNNVKNREYEEAFKLIESGENVNSRELKNYKTLAHIVCGKGDLDSLKRLVKFDVNLESLDYEFMTPVFEAIMSCNLSLIDYMIYEMKVNINHREIQDRTPFYWAACNGDIEVIDYLISKNVEVDLCSSMGRTPLSKAAWNGRVDIVERLVKIPYVDINKVDQNGRSPLHNAVWGENGGRLGKKVSGVSSNDSPECVQCLIDHGANLECEDKDGYTPLLISASTGGSSSLELLIKKGANPNHKNFNKATALIEASRYMNNECVRILLQNAKNLEIYCKDLNNMSAIDYAVSNENTECFKIFMEYTNLNDHEVSQLLNTCVLSNSVKCFYLIICELKKNQYFVKNSFELLNLLIDKVINLSLLKIFNIIIDEFRNYVEFIFSQNILYLIKSIILLESINNFQKYDSNLYEDEYIEFNENYQNEEIKKFSDEIEIMFYHQLELIKNNQKISDLFLKTMIYFEKHDMIYRVFELINNHEINLIIDKFHFDITDFIKLIIIKKRKKEVNLYNIWENILYDINNNNIVSLAIIKNFNIEKILEYKIFHKFLFEKIFDEKNILHILFSSDDKNRFKFIINFIEKFYPNKILFLISMFDDEDINSLTPLDSIMKNKLFNLVKDYTEEINDLRKRHSIKNDRQYFYKVNEFLIQEDYEIGPSQDYLNYLENYINPVECDKKYYNTSEKYKNYSLIDKIKNNMFINELKIKNTSYNYTWINNTELLEECTNHLLKHEFIGVDLEYHGNEKSGIVCVLQISTIEKSYAIDTLILRNEITTFLKYIFESENIIKIFHGCDNDIIWLITNFEIFTRNIFDTGRAFIIFQNIIQGNKTFRNLPSLSYLSKFFLQTEIDKSYQKSDWRIRPLTKNMLQYALNDAKIVVNLFLIYKSLGEYITNNLNNNEFYDNLISKFKENSDNIKSFILNRKYENSNTIFSEIYHKCLEIIKLKLKDKYIKLNVLNIN